MTVKLGLVIIITIASCSALPGYSVCSCPHRLQPVCGSDGRLYPNQCVLVCTNSLLKSDVRVLKDGPCDANCSCSEEESPVCGSDGVTYKNICGLRCARLEKHSLEVDGPGDCQRLKRQRRGLAYEKRFQLWKAKTMHICPVLV